MVEAPRQGDSEGAAFLHASIASISAKHAVRRRNGGGGLEWMLRREVECVQNLEWRITGGGGGAQPGRNAQSCAASVSSSPDSPADRLGDRLGKRPPTPFGNFACTFDCACSGRRGSGSAKTFPLSAFLLVES